MQACAQGWGVWGFKTHGGVDLQSRCKANDVLTGYGPRPIIGAPPPAAPGPARGGVPVGSPTGPPHPPGPATGAIAGPLAETVAPGCPGGPVTPTPAGVLGRAWGGGEPPTAAEADRGMGMGMGSAAGATRRLMASPARHADCTDDAGLSVQQYSPRPFRLSIARVRAVESWGVRRNTARYTLPDLAPVGRGHRRARRAAEGSRELCTGGGRGQGT